MHTDDGRDWKTREEQQKAEDRRLKIKEIKSIYSEMLEALINQYIEICRPCKKCNPEYENCYSCEAQEESKILIEKATGLKIEEVLK